MPSLRQRIAAWIAGKPAAPALSPARSGARMYASAMSSRLTDGWNAQTTSGDSELVASLRNLRNRSRQLQRDYGYARRARSIIVNNVIGAGVGLQAAVTIGDRLHDNVNRGIERAWFDWSRARSCHTGGVLHFADLERQAIGQWFEAGECFIRIHRRPFGDSAIPFALELIEPERLAEEYEQRIAYAAGNLVRMGIEVDPFHRPVAYHIHSVHPADMRVHPQARTQIERVPAADILHLYLPERWPQTRGIPAMHAVAKRLWDMDGYTEAEIVAARAAATYMGFIKTDAAPDLTDGADTQPEITLEAGMVQRLGSGEDFVGWNPNRPNPNMDPFLRYMLREMAAGMDVSYESLSRDYSQSNYSSARQGILEDRDVFRVMQAWWRRTFREPLHRLWLESAVLSGAVPEVAKERYILDRARYEAAIFKFRGWSWVDPTKEVTAYKEAVKAGFTTVGDVIAATSGGLDFEDVMTARQRELEVMEDKGLYFDTEVEEPPEPAEPEPTNPPPDEDDDEGAAAARAHLRAVRGAP